MAVDYGYVDFAGKNGGFRINYKETTNLTANTSVIEVIGCMCLSSNYYLTSFYGDGIVQINGTTVVTLTNDSAHSAYVESQWEWYDIAGSTASRSVTVNHSADGSGTVTFTLTGRPGVYNDMNLFCGAGVAGNIAINGSQSVNLIKIDRSFNLSLSAGKNTSITVNRTSSPLGGSIGQLYNGSTIYYGDTINVSYSVGTGCNISTHTVNGSTFTSGQSYTVTGAISVVTTATVNSYMLSLSAWAHTSITVNRTSSPKQGAAQGYLSDGSTIYYGDVLSISYGVSIGYNIATHTLNGSTFTSGTSHTVTGKVTVVTTATVKVFALTRNVGPGLGLTVNRTSSPNGGGNTGIMTDNVIYYGDVLELTATANAGYNIEVMSINGSSYGDNPHTHTVTADVTVIIASKALGFVYIDSGASIEKYKIVIDSGSAMEQYRAMIDTGSAIVPY